MVLVRQVFYFFFFNDTATTEIYTLSLHDALPISMRPSYGGCKSWIELEREIDTGFAARSEEHTSELQSPDHLLCRLLLVKKKTKNRSYNPTTHSRIAFHARLRSTLEVWTRVLWQH